jgi:hypothetical protein
MGLLAEQETGCANGNNITCRSSRRFAEDKGEALKESGEMEYERVVPWEESKMHRLRMDMRGVIMALWEGSEQAFLM